MGRKSTFTPVAVAGVPVHDTRIVVGPVASAVTVKVSAATAARSGGIATTAPKTRTSPAMSGTNLAAWGCARRDRVIADLLGRPTLRPVPRTT